MHEHVLTYYVKSSMLACATVLGPFEAVCIWRDEGRDRNVGMLPMQRIA